jgi:hypothetical protein
MKTRITSSSLFRSASLGALFLLGQLTASASTPSVVDDFSSAETTSIGAPRIVINDASIGGTSHLEQSVTDGVLSAKGEIAPARGQPGFVSMVLPLANPGEAMDLSEYEGIRIRVRIGSGTLSISANSNEVQNFDYHTAVVTRSADGDFHEVRIPWSKMRRVWSEQTSLNPATINSLSLVAAHTQKSTFSYEVDEVGFY